MSFTFKNSFNESITINLKPERYLNDNLAIMVFETEPEDIYDDSYYCDLTTNFSEQLKNPDLFYLDTNNVPYNLIAVLEKNGIFTYTGNVHPSGFCTYPICQLTEKGKALLEL